MKVAIYVRVSTQEQAKEGYSVNEQQEKLTDYAKAHGWHIYQTYADPGFSGKDTNRPALQRLIADIKMHRIDAVLIWKFDRLSRSQKDMLTMIEDVLEPNHCDLVSITENFDTTSQLGKAMTGVLAVFAQLEREQIKERMSMGREARAKEGYYTGCNDRPPLGYTVEDGILKINPYEALAVRRMFELCLENKAPYTIAKILTNEGYKPRNKAWIYQTVQKTLQSRIYIGEVSYAGKWYQGLHEPIIDKETFEAASEISKERSRFTKEFYSNSGKATSYFAGLLFCGRCGRKVYKQSNPSTEKGMPIKRMYLKCIGRTHYKYSGNVTPCDLPYYKLEDLEEELLNEIRKLAIEPNYYEQAKSSSTPEDNQKIIEAEIKKVDAQISRLMDLYSIGSVPVDILQDKLNDLNEKRNALNSQLLSAKDHKAMLKKAKKIEKTIKQIPDILDHGSFDEIRNLIQMLIEKIVLNGEDKEIYWRF